MLNKEFFVTHYVDIYVTKETFDKIDRSGNVYESADGEHLEFDADDFDIDSFEGLLLSKEDIEEIKKEVDIDKLLAVRVFIER